MDDSLFSSIGMMIALSAGLLTGSERRAIPPASPVSDLQTAPPHGRTIMRGTDGLFHVEALVNGRPIRFVLDTGANVTVLSASDAGKAGLLDGRLIYDERMIAGGGHVSIARTTLASARVMDRDFADLPVTVARGSFPVSVLGQDLLRRLGPCWIGGDALVIGAKMPDAAALPL